MRQRIVRGIVAAGLAAMGALADAATIVGVSPQGEVAQVRQVTVRFDAAVVRFGAPGLADPMRVDCDGAAPAGSGRWASDRIWLYDLREPLPPGTRCRVTLRADWQPLAGRVTGRGEFSFGTGGPALVSVQPWDGATIEEDQHFLLQLNGAAVAASVEANAWCEIEGIGERVPLRLVEGPAREAVIRARRLEKSAERTLLLACTRPLPNEARVRLVWGQGIAAQANPQVRTSVAQHHDFQVRGAFKADFSCERERAEAPCLPIRPLMLRFSASVPRALAQQVRLRAADGTVLAPAFDADDPAAEVHELRFPTPLAENARFTIVLPPDLRDSAGRALANAASFPLAVATGEAPPIAKFAAAPFGIVERGGEGRPEALLPLTLRHLQGELRPGARAGSVRVRRLQTDAEILEWYARLKRHHEARLPARELGLPERDWTETVQETDARGRVVTRRVDRLVATREVPLLAQDAQARRLDLPQLEGGDPRPFEVIGVALPEPGFHVVEVESARLGAALLDRTAPMFVRTGVLVTNLGVHLKQGRENSLVWVTTLDRARPVAGADVAVHDCRGGTLWRGRTGADGIARIAQALPGPGGDCPADEGLFVTARHADAAGAVDVAFVFGSWQRGIEPWRFELPSAFDAAPGLRAHTVFDRTLLRAGETVSMKHFVRHETLAGLAMVDAAQRPERLRIVHEGSGQEFVQPLRWSGARHALSSWRIPSAARLGLYRVLLERGDERERRSWESGTFRIEAFRVPLVDARLSAPKAVAIAPPSLPFGVQMSYLAGGAMKNAPLRVSALLRPRDAAFAGHEGFSFEPPREGDEASAAGGRDERLVADKLALATDAQGRAGFTLDALPPITRPGEIVAELSYADPNGETQTVATSVPVWPSAVVLGIRASGWASRGGRVDFGVVALDTAGVPIRGQAVEVRARLAQTISTRKRLVGGFYAYDNRTEYSELGTLCRGRTDRQGRLACDATLARAGQVELIAHAVDAAGRAVQAATGVWITAHGELWFAQDDDDRIELLPEKKRYEPGETARLQVRMPFREATALLSVEREGVIESRVVTLRGDAPSVEVKIAEGWAPNVYVSVLALRGRVRDVPGSSFFDWGWRHPLDWARAYWFEGRDYRAPTATVDLAKPAFRLGAAALEVGLAAHELQVEVKADQPQYQVRQTAKVRVAVRHAGRPLAGAEIAFAAVDEGLLALRENDSWDLLRAMLRPRPWGVATATAQGEIVGRRHYGRKAVAAGGGGGRGGTRELFDTLLLWRPQVVLDANGEALVEVPLNDSLTSFRLVAVADAGAQRFGSGSTRIRVTQDLQLLPGLPPLVRDGDRFAALLTLRNTTARPMTLTATLAGSALHDDGRRSPITLAPQNLTLAADAAQELSWPVEVPAATSSIEWEAAVQEQGGGGATDRLRITQRVDPAVPLRVVQAALLPLDGRVALPVAAPAGALPATGPKRGGLTVALQPSLGAALPGLRRFFETYPYTCLEQKASQAVGLGDAQRWAALVETLPTHLDADGLASYFPARPEDDARGSDRLTAYLLALADESGFALPEGTRRAMLDGLAAFVEGRIERRSWSPRPDRDVRKLAAIEALARHGRASPSMLGSLNLAPNTWPTAALIDWLAILKRVDGIADRARRLAEAQQILRARLDTSGTALRFSTEEGDAWWWLMDSADANAARLILVLLDDPAWRAELPQLVLGSLARQQRGAWATTTANAWGALALARFGAAFESAKVTGRTQAEAGAAPQAIDWSRDAAGGRMLLPWPAGAGTLNVVHEGSGRPWLTLQALAAVAPTAAVRAGYALQRSVVAVERRDPARWSRGDLLRVRLEIDAAADGSWVVVDDPVPGGASVLGGGLARDSALATRGEDREGSAWPTHVERGADAYRAYFEWLPRGRHVLEYTLRLNNPGRFALPPTRVEAMYAPERFGELPNEALEVAP